MVLAVVEMVPVVLEIAQMVVEIAPLEPKIVQMVVQIPQMVPAVPVPALAGLALSKKTPLSTNSTPCFPPPT